MALDQAYFDAIHIDVVKKKYYNANKVEAVLEDIRRQAQELTAENARLMQLSGQKNEIVDTLLSAKTIAQQILQEARAEADRILAEAREEADGILAEAEARRSASMAEALAGQEAEVQRMEACYSRVREQLLSCVDSLNADWQDYLCAIGDEKEQSPAPGDLEEKVGRIVEAMRALDEEEPVGIGSGEA